MPRVHEESILKARKVFVGAEVTFAREFYPVTHVEHTDYLKGRPGSRSPSKVTMCAIDVL